MRTLRTLLLGLSLLIAVVLIWDSLPFYTGAQAESEPRPAGETNLANNLATATFAGGCFWCMEPPFDHLPGVVATTSGYTGGSLVNPTYAEVSAGGSGHVEAVQVTYDPAQVSYETLLNVFWQNIDPLDDSGQFCDKGSQYRSAIFTGSSQEAALATASKQALAAEKSFGQPIATDIVAAQTFYPAETYHQDYYLKHPVRYKVYRTGCGRDRRLAQLWSSSS
jgi:peptide-methionine (S)-S-oxide reductase